MTGKVNLEDISKQGSEQKDLNKKRWKAEKLGDLAVYQNGNSFSKSQWSDKGYPIIRIQNLTGEQEEYNHFDGDLGEKYKVENGDILLAWSGTIDLFRWEGEEAALNQHIYRVDTQDGINNIFFQFKLEEAIPRLIALSHGSTMKHVRKADLVNLDVEIPAELSEQRRVASVLYNVDQAIQKTEEIIEQTRRVKKGLMQDLFTEGYFHHNLTARSIGPKEYNLPGDWTILTIKEAMDNNWIEKQQDGNHGSDYPRKEDFVDSGTPYISAKNLEDQRVNLNEAKHLTQQKVDSLRKGFAQDGDVLLAHNATVGDNALLQTNFDPVIISTSLTYYRVNEERIHNKYLMHYFNSEIFQRQLESIMKQTTRNQVPITAQRNFQILVPGIKEQRKIADSLEIFSERITKGKQRVKSLQQIKKGLMQDLLTGEVRTKDKDVEVLDEVLEVEKS